MTFPLPRPDSAARQEEPMSIPRLPDEPESWGHHEPLGEACGVYFPRSVVRTKYVRGSIWTATVKFAVAQTPFALLRSFLCCLRISGRLNSTFLTLTSFAIFLTLLRPT